MLSRSICAALFAAACGWSDPAAATTYILSGDAAGQSLDLSVQNAAITPFSTLHVEIDFFSSGPGTDLIGEAIIVPIGSANVLALSLTAPITDVPPQSYFVVGEGPNVGNGVFGASDGTTFTTHIFFHGSGLDGYDGVSTLAPVPVTIGQFDGFQITNPLNSDTLGIEFTSFSNDWTFSAAVPEPATWAMFLIGFGGIGFMMRNSRRKSAVATG